MSNKRKSIIVTGSSGTIGTRLMQTLISKGYKVIGIDKVKNKWDKKVNSLTKIIDLRNQSKLLELNVKADIIIHLAANARVYNLVVNPKLAKDNVSTVFNVCEFARKKNIKKILFASSREVYGDSGLILHSEEDAYMKNCESPYTASKVFGETLITSYMKCYEINYLIYRFSNVYGMYDGSDRVIPLFIEKMHKNKPIVIFGKDKLLDFTYIDDAVDGILLGIRNFNKAKNETYNIANGKGNSILDVAKFISKKMKSTSKITIMNNRTGEVIKYVAKINKARKRLNYKSKYTFEEGLNKTIIWYKRNYL